MQKPEVEVYDISILQIRQFTHRQVFAGLQLTEDIF